jgi:branched-chain amino acid aminotransferase
MEHFPRHAYFEGRIVPIDEAKVSVMNHALNYGTAAFGGLRGYWNADENQLFIFRPVDHFTRLLSSAKMLMIDIPFSAEGLRDLLVELLRLENFRENVYVRPLVYKNMNGIGVKLHDVPGEFTMFAFPFGSYIPNESAGIRVGNSIPARGKIAGAYVNSALIKTEAVLNGFDEALVLNASGHISEASAANFFMVRHGKVITPPVSADVLEGITRNTIITLLREQVGVEVEEREIDRTESYLAQEAFLCGTGVQVAPIVNVDHRQVGSGEIGEITRNLSRVFHDVVRGKMPQYRHWLHGVFAAETVGA